DLNLQLGARYTDTDIDFSGCSLNAANQTFAIGFSRSLGYTGVIPLGECVTFSNTTPQVPELFVDSKSESNVSWRAGLDWDVGTNTLLYANVSRGYKAGGYPTLPATNAPQYTPMDQEKITAYEVGVKATLFERTLQLNGAVFYNDYVDKQLKGRTIVPVFGPLEALVNIPKSKVQGAELQINWAPIAGLRLSSGLTYLDTEVTEGSPGGNYTTFGGAVRTNLKGQEFPYMSEWQISADGEYSFGLTNALDGFVGVGANYRSKANGDFLPDPRLDIDAYTLIDLRLGVASSDEKWRATLYGRNITDEYYWVTANRRTDSVVRYAGMPRTYGISLSYRY
ncbi:TonB-dependent receptor domain-containing protein, partial [Steroidobacter sp.]|uniref:TonB-dependent receptor domain-containing protein n=1 Tax=Steroidobacter sp. TaxID=1978227 RepID=UPI001A4300B3